MAEKATQNPGVLEWDLDDFRLETTIKHLAVAVINYQISSPRNMSVLSVA